MAFPTDLEIEVAFNNDIDETDYAQSGWTSILPFVSGFSGDLRGRGYELDRAEAGSLSVTLDNSDGRFLPGSVQSPYYPNVKANRRFRIRGKNMVHPNVARGGSRDRDMTGYLNPSDNEAAYDGIWNSNTTWSQSAVSMDSVRIITASAEPLAASGEGKEKANDGLATTKWTVLTTSGWLTYKYAISIRMQTYSVTTANDFPNRDPKTWTLQGSNNGSSWTTIHTVTNNVWTDRYEQQTFTITSPGYYTYYKLDITANWGDSVLQLSELTLNYNDASDLVLVDSDLTYYAEMQVENNQALSQYHRLTSWFVPVEYGVRLAHSAYLWRISGTEPTGAKLKFHITYWDDTWTQVNSTVDPNFEITSLPTSNTPTQVGFSHTPPADAKYGVVSVSVWISTTPNLGQLIYGVTGIQSELPVNFSPDISGFRDQFNWQMQSEDNTPGTYVNVGSDPTTSYLSVLWAVNDANLYISVPHLIPGEKYTATVQAQKVGTQPNILFSGDEGETGALISTTTMTQYTITFEAQQAEQELRFILQGVPALGEGLRIRKLRVEKGDNLTLALPTTAIEAGYTTWTRPKDIFEGWIDSWPAVAGSPSMTITTADRMKRLGDVELSNTLRESLQQDVPALLMPLSDSQLDTAGRFSQLGYWADIDNGGLTYIDISKTRGDIGTATYTTQTDDGPTGEASFLNQPQSPTIGYLFAIASSKDFTPYIPPPPPPSRPKPPPSKPKPSESPKYTYTKKWYATWSRSYEGDDSTRFDDSDYMYQGQFSGSPGNQKSLAGFDYKNIMATLKGAEILEAHVTVKNAHARWNKGLYAYLGYHTYSSKPSTWNGANVTERKWKKWVTEDGSGSVSMGATVGRAFQNGSVKGISIGPESDSDHYGFFYGAKQSGKPYITIKYRK